MSEFVLNNGRIINDSSEPYIVAEINSSHGGNVDVARKMIEKAKEIGCDCVKFQSWSKESLYSATYYKENPIAERFVKKFSLSFEQQKKLSDFCKEIDISFASTPYCREEVDFLIKDCNVPFMKIASMDINNRDFIKYIAERKIPIVLSTGMSDFEEIDKAVQCIKETGNANLCILHCVSVYPADDDIINLNNITTLKNRYPQYVIGYSDHSIGHAIPAASVAMGARIIEKHFTLDKSVIGMDNNMATEPVDFKTMIDSCRAVYKSLGSRERQFSEAELVQREKMRRSIVATRDMESGEILKVDDMDVKRPGNGYPPEKVHELIGKALKKNICKDEIVTESHIQ